jgi:endonuclease YncB( thermonuclease family)
MSSYPNPRLTRRAPGRRRKARSTFREVRLMVLVGAFLGLAVAGPGHGGSGAAAPAAAAPVRVIDGDTFDYRGERIRVADIDTPEVRGRCAYETELAARTTARMRLLLAQGPFELHTLANGRDEDRYGRKLRIVTRGGRSLGDMLVAEGLARTWTGRREPWCT